MPFLLIVLRRTLAAASCLDLFGQQDRVNIGQNATRSNRHIPQQFVEFFIILHGQGNMAGNDASLFVVAGSVAGQFQNFGTQIFQNILNEDRHVR